MNQYLFVFCFFQLVKLLLESGAHLDQSNKTGERPSVTIGHNTRSTVNLVNYTTLRCLASVVVVKHKIPYKGQIPTTLENFVRLHDVNHDVSDNIHM